jgi:prepilin-type N-terminal cleavage/methylation domain-containing protein
MKRVSETSKSESGFSLIELIIAMVITVVITTAVGTLLVQSVNLRTRSNDKTDALADAQRALNIMSREIAAAGLNLSDNGLVAADSVTDANGNSTIRIRSNINKFNPSGTASLAAQNGIGTIGEDAGEDVKYYIHPASNTNLLARYDAYNVSGGSSTVLANRLDSLHIHYFASKVTYSTSGCDISSASASEVSPSAAKYVVIAVCVAQNAVGTPGTAGYQPPTNVLLVSDVTLRNSNLVDY